MTTRSFVWIHVRFLQTGRTAVLPTDGGDSMDARHRLLAIIHAQMDGSADAEPASPESGGLRRPPIARARGSGDLAAHHAIAAAFRSDVLEAGLFEQRARAV